MFAWPSTLVCISMTRSIPNGAHICRNEIKGYATTLGCLLKKVGRNSLKGQTTTTDHVKVIVGYN